ncbi:MAG: hypothetical protein ACREJO_09875 [Phycisphaerales bacterium]
MLTKYKSSGQFTTGFVPLLPVMLGGAALLAVIYQFAVHYCPLIKINFIICTLFALAVGWLVAKGLKLSKCRHAGVALLVAIPVALGAVLASHYVEYLMQTSGAPGTVSLDRYIEYRINSGWMIGSSSSNSHKTSPDISGWGVWTLWTIEALLVIGIAAGFAFAAVDDPYCEECQQWATRKVVNFVVSNVNDDTVATIHAADHVATLVTPRPDPAIASMPEPTASPPKGGPAVAVGTTRTALRYDLIACPVCDKSQFLTVSAEVVKQAAKKKIEKTITKLHEHVVLTADEAAAIQAMAGERHSATPPLKPS